MTVKKNTFSIKDLLSTRSSVIEQITKALANVNNLSPDDKGHLLNMLSDAAGRGFDRCADYLSQFIETSAPEPVCDVSPSQQDCDVVETYLLNYADREGRVMQPVVIEKGCPVFKANKIVKTLLNTGKLSMNDLMAIKFTTSDREQFAQLIGYSVDGFCGLPYTSPGAVEFVRHAQATLFRTAKKHASV